MRRFLLISGLAAALVAAAAAVWGYGTATADPLVRRIQLEMPNWPADSEPVKAVLISDIHVSGPDMPPDRFRRIVDRINSLDPDFLFIAGDFTSAKKGSTRHYSVAESIAPLAGLSPGIQAFGVLGNNDSWRAAELRRLLPGVRVRLLENEAVAAGPLLVGGLSDTRDWRVRLDTLLGDMRDRPGAQLILSHPPNALPHLPAEISLFLAGHTHCGQIALPFLDEPCGLVRRGSTRMILTAGLGTSAIPVRLGAGPDMWLLTLGPAAQGAARN